MRAAESPAAAAAGCQRLLSLAGRSSTPTPEWVLPGRKTQRLDVGKGLSHILCPLVNKGVAPLQGAAAPVMPSKTKQGHWGTREAALVTFAPPVTAPQRHRDGSQSHSPLGAAAPQWGVWNSPKIPPWLQRGLSGTALSSASHAQSHGSEDRDMLSPSDSPTVLVTAGIETVTGASRVFQVFPAPMGETEAQGQPQGCGRRQWQEAVARSRQDQVTCGGTCGTLAFVTLPATRGINKCLTFPHCRQALGLKQNIISKLIRRQ